MSELPVIPTPPSQKFREFRVRFLPPLIFLCTLAGIFVLWKDYVSPPTLVGQVETVITPVTSRNAGVLTNVFVQRFQEVRAGEIVAEVRVTDHRRYDTDLELLRSQVALSQLELGTLADRQRLALDYENLRVDYMRQQTELAMAKAQLPHAQFDVDLSKRLLADKVVSEFEYHSFLSRFDSLKAQVEQLTTNVQQLETKLQDSREFLDTIGEAGASKELVQRLKKLQAQQRTLEDLGSAPLLIEAPISGVVMEVLRRPGENLLPGDPILTISSKQGERIVGYLRPPLTIEPKPGMAVQIRPRTLPREEAEGRISGVGASFEVVTNLALARPNTVPELGLPISIGVPGPMVNRLRPGELIDIVIRTP
jgi:multidrug resistance efflux pump